MKKNIKDEKVFNAKSVISNTMCKYESPKILAVDIGKENIEELKGKGFNIESGTFGYRYRCEPYDEVELNGELPFITEKDIAIVNLLTTKDIKEWGDYKAGCLSADRLCIYVPQGQEYFNPSYFYSKSNKANFRKILDNAGIIIVFTSSKEVESYYFARYKENRVQEYQDEEVSNYDWLPTGLWVDNCTAGKEIFVESKIPQLESLGKMLLKDNEVLYQCNFGSASNKEANIFSNNLGESLGFIDYIKQGDKMGVEIILPQFKDKAKAIEILFKELVVKFRPDLFPQYVENNWLNEDDYILPEVRDVIKEKEKLQEEYRKQINAIEKRKKEIEEKQRFLTNILIVDGYDKFLVNNVKKVLEFIGYKEVIDVDSEIEEGNRQEDLRILDFDRFDIIEVKGHKGSPTEDDCQAVVKYISRQMREQNRTDIHGILIVNHNRIMPPLERKNPAFTEAQIIDSKRDHYTLVSTWELYKSARLLQEGIIKFEDIDRGLHTPGLYKALPTNWQSIGKIEHLFKQNTIACFYLSVDKISINDEIVIQDKNNYFHQKVEEMQVNDKLVNEAIKGDQLSIKINKSISKTAVVYLIVK